jgi:hypothetical protein
MEPPQFDKPVFEDAAEDSPAVTSLCESPYPDIRRVHCYLRDGIARLEGRLPTYHQKQLAQEIVRRAVGVHSVVNHIVVAKPSDAIESRDFRRSYQVE